MMDRLDTMRAFAAVVAAGSFKGGADALGWSTALVSKYVARLEDRLDVRLLNRTTRRVAPTEAGRAYYERCVGLIDDFDALDDQARKAESAPRGTLRIAAPRTFGETHVTPAVTDFLRLYPDISVDMRLADRYVDLTEEGFDLALRIGALADSSLLTRRIADVRHVVCASPDYLARQGEPLTPADLAAHPCLIDLNLRTGEHWAFAIEGETRLVRVFGRLKVDSAMAARVAALAGAGIARVPEFVVLDDLRRGALRAVLQEYRPAATALQAVYPANRHLSTKVRVFIDFLIARYRDGLI